MLDQNTLILLCNVIPAMIVLYYIFKGWVKGGLYMLILVVKLFGSFIITRFLSNYSANLLYSNSTVKNQITSFVLNNKETLTQLPGASLLFTGGIIQNNLEGISFWIIYFLSFIIIFLLLMIIFSLILKAAINFNKIPILGVINKLLGSLEGLIFGLVLVLILIYMVSFILNLFGYYEIQQVLMSSWLPVIFRTVF